jgi:H+/Cl- antiporter ClcA
MNKLPEFPSALSRWTAGSRAWVLAVVAACFFSLVGGVVVFGFTVLLVHVLLWVRLASGSRLLKQAEGPAHECDEARSVLTIIVVFQVFGLLFLAWLLLNLANVDLNTH